MMGKGKIVNIDQLNGRYAYVDVALCRDIPVNDFNVRPGMYAQFSFGHGTKCYFAIVDTDVESNSVKLLLRHDSVPYKDIINIYNNTSLNDVEVGEPSGGFKLDGTDANDVVCIAAGSGISTMIPLIRHITARRGRDRKTSLIYLESDDTHVQLDDVLDCHVHYVKTQGVLSTNKSLPILGTISQLSRTLQPITYMGRPIFFVCGRHEFVERLRDAIVPIYTHSNDFRTNL